MDDLSRTLSLCIVSLSLVGCGLLMSREDRDKVAAACKGQAVEGTRSHEKDPRGFLVFIQKQGDGPYDWSVNGVHYKLANTTKISEVNTVFCMDAPVELPQGECAFDSTEGVGIAGVQVIETARSRGPSFPRVGVSRSARMVDPATGKTLAEHTITVAAPGCDSGVGEPVAAYFVAQPPSAIAFADWATAELGIKK